MKQAAKQKSIVKQFALILMFFTLLLPFARVQGQNICRIGSTEFATLNEAVSYARDNMGGTATIEMLTDYSIPNSDKVTLNQASDHIIITTASTGFTPSFGTGDGRLTTDGNRAIIKRGNLANSFFLLLANGTLTFEDIILDGNNVAVSDHGGLVKATSGLVTVRGGTIMRNTRMNDGKYGAAIYSESNVANSVTIDNAVGKTVEFRNCVSQRDGGAIRVTKGCYINNAGTLVFEECSANYGGAIEANNNGCYITIVNSGTITFKKCTTTNKNYNGGALNSYHGPVTITNSDAGVIRFDECTAKTEGGAIYAGGNVSITNNNTSRTEFVSCTGTSGGAIYATGYVSILESTTFTFCSATSGNGGAVYSVGTTTITQSGTGNVSFANCNAKSYGGAVYSKQNATVRGTSANPITFENCSSTTGYGGGVYQNEGSLMTLEYLTFGAYQTDGLGNIILDSKGNPIADMDKGCSAANFGGAVCYDPSSGKVTASHCSFLGSQTTGTSYGGGALGCDGTAELTDCMFVGCHSSTYGGAINSASTTFFGENTLRDCSAATNGGAANLNTVMFSPSSTTRFIGCSAASNGGGAYFNGATTVDAGATIVFDSCRATTNGGGAYFNAANTTIKGVFSFEDCYSTGGKGGGAYFANTLTLSGTADLTFTRCHTESTNTSNGGGGAYFASTATIDTLATIVFDSCYAATNGGGAYFNAAINNTIKGDLSFEDCYSTGGKGGGAYFANTLTLSGTADLTFTRCHTESTNTSNGGGGAWFNAAVTANNGAFLTFDSCYAATNGGGAYFVTTATLGDGVTISNCSATNGGGAYYGSASNALTLSGATVTRCSASNQGGGVYSKGNLILANGAAITENKILVWKPAGAGENYPADSVAEVKKENGAGLFIENGKTLTVGADTISVETVQVRDNYVQVRDSVDVLAEASCNARISMSGANNATSAVSVKSHLDNAYIGVCNAHSIGTQFGTNTLESSMERRGLANIEADDGSSYGTIDMVASGGNRTKVYWKAPIICKITDANHNLLYYKPDAAKEEAVFSRLEDAVNYFNKGFFYETGDDTIKPVYIEMLVESYAVKKTIRPAAGDTIILTTADILATDYPYTGTPGTSCTLYRGSLTSSMFAMSNANTCFTVTDITMDGRKSETSTVVTPNGFNFISVSNATARMILDSLTILQNSKRELTGTSYGAVYVTNGVFEMRDSSKIKDCEGKDGGAIYVTGGTLQLAGGVIENCTATNGGAIFATGNGNKTFMGGKDTSTVIRNCVAVKGGALYLQGSNYKKPEVTEEYHPVEVQNCTADNGGGVYANSGSPVLYNFAFIGCSAENSGVYGNGGAAYINGGTLTLSGCTIDGDNKMNAQYGGAVYVASGATVNLNICPFNPLPETTHSVWDEVTEAYEEQPLDTLPLMGISTLIQNCTVSEKGSAVYVAGSGKLYTNSDGAVYDSLYVGISDNTGDGAIVPETSSILYFGGDTRVKDNLTGGEQKNVVLAYNKNTIISTTTYGLGGNAEVGIYVEDPWFDGATDANRHGQENDNFGKYQKDNGLELFVNDRNGLTGEANLENNSRFIRWGSPVCKLTDTTDILLYYRVNTTLPLTDDNMKKAVYSSVRLGFKKAEIELYTRTGTDSYESYGTATSLKLKLLRDFNHGSEAVYTAGRNMLMTTAEASLVDIPAAPFAQDTFIYVPTNAVEDTLGTHYDPYETVRKPNMAVLRKANKGVSMFTIKPGSSYSFTVQNLVFDGDSLSFTGNGGAFNVSNLGEFRIDSVDFVNFISRNGGAVDVTSSGMNLVIKSSKFLNCTASSSGGAIHSKNPMTLTNIGNTLMRKCKALGGPGGAVYAEHDLSILNQTGGTLAFEKDTANHWGGAVCVDHNNHYFRINGNNGTISCTECCAAYGGGMEADNSTRFIANDNSGTISFIRCSTKSPAAGVWSTELGGGLHADNSIEITNNSGTFLFEDCVAEAVQKSKGGGIQASKEMTLESTGDGRFIFRNCHSYYGGGAHAGQKMIISGATFEGCYATTSSEATSGNGGAIHAGANAELTNIKIDGSGIPAGMQNAKKGAAIYTTGNLTLKGDAAGSAAEVKTIITGCSASDANGGAVNVASGKKMEFEGDVIIYDNGDTNALGEIVLQKNVMLEQNNTTTIWTTDDGLGKYAHIGVYVTGNNANPFNTHGKFEQDFGTHQTSTANLRTFTNDRDLTLHGEDCPDHASANLIRWTGFLCKLTDKDGNLLYTTTATNLADSKTVTIGVTDTTVYPAVYDFLMTQNGSDTIVGGFTEAQGTLYTLAGVEVGSTDTIFVQMLKNYTMPQTDTVVVTGTRPVVLKTANTVAASNPLPEDVYVYNKGTASGVNDSLATITRGYDGGSMFTVSSEELNVTRVIIDGSKGSSMEANTNGGVFKVNSGSTLGINANALVKNSKTSGNGGAIYSAGTVKIKGGTIAGNEATNGGAIYTAGPVLDLRGGEITGNTATGKGGGVYVEDTQNEDDYAAQHIVKVGGNVTVTGNTVSGAANNLYVMSRNNIQLVETLGSGSEVGVYCDRSATAYPDYCCTTYGMRYDDLFARVDHSENTTVEGAEHFSNDLAPTITGEITSSDHREAGGYTAGQGPDGNSTDVAVKWECETEPPTYTRPINITLYKDDNCVADTLPAVTGEPTNLADNCTNVDSLKVSYRNGEFSSICTGSYSFKRIWKVVDACGNVSVSDSVQTITVLDTMRPRYTRPNDTTLYKNNLCVADTLPTAIGAPTALWDNCTAASDLSVSYRNSEFSSSCTGSYSFKRIWKVVDACGNVSVSDSVQTVTVRDTTKPTFTVPADTLICANNDGTLDTVPAMTGMVTDAADNCTASPAVTHSDVLVSGDVHSIRTFVRTWTVTDDCGNSTEKTQTIRVKPQVYSYVPAVYVCPGENAVLADTLKQVWSKHSVTWQFNGVNLHTDADIAMPTTHEEVLNYTVDMSSYTSCDASYPYVVNYTDESGCEVSATSTVTIRIPASFDKPANDTSDVQCMSDVEAPHLVSGYTMPTVKDGCGETLSFTASSPVRTRATNNDCQDQIVYTYTYKACDNTTTDWKYVYNLKDTQAPVVTGGIPDTTLAGTCSANISASYPAATTYAELQAVVNQLHGTLTVADNCTVDPDYLVITSSESNTTVGCEIHITRTYTIADTCGKSTTVSQNIYVHDTVKPTFASTLITEKAADNDGACHYSYPDLREIVRAASSDNCTARADLTVEQRPVQGAAITVEDAAQTLPVRVVVTDACGNKDSVTINVTVPARLTATITATTEETCTGNDGTATVTGANGSPFTAGGETFYHYRWNTTPEQSGQTAYTLSEGRYYVTVTDAHGCEAYANDTIYLHNPYAGLLPNDTTVIICSDGSFSVIPSYLPSTATYSWTAPTSATLTGMAAGLDQTSVSGTLHNTVTTPQTVVYEVIPQIGICPSSHWTVYVDVNVTVNPAIDVVLSSNSPLCADDDAELTATISHIYSIYDVAWTFNSGNVSTMSDVRVPSTNDTVLTVTVPAGFSSCTGTYNWSITYSDASGCASTKSADVEVTIPTWSITEADFITTVACSDQVATPGASLLPVVKDGCENVLTPSAPVITRKTNNDCNDTITYTYTYTACDHTSDTWSYIYVVRDTMRPTYTRPADTVLYKNNLCVADTATTAIGVPTSLWDNCTASTDLVVTYRNEEFSSSCTGSYSFKRIWKVVDNCGNVSVSDSVQVIEVRDTMRPTFTVPDDTTICRVNGEIEAPVTTTGDVTDEADNCTTTLDATWTDLDTLPADNSGNRIIRREWTLVDDCGNTTTDLQTITVRPSVLTPGNIEFFCPDTTVTLKYGACDTLIELHRELINHMTGMTLVLDSTGHTHNHRYNVDFSPYTITWRVTDECGDYREFTQTVTVKYPPCGGSYWVEDGDHNWYPTVQAGCNCWTGRNARSTHYVGGASIEPAPMQYPGTENHPEDTIYGKLYTYYAATGITPTRATRSVPQQMQGICPDGWHIPDDGDFEDLMARYEGPQLMSATPGHWLEPGTDESGFTLEPAGLFNPVLIRYEYLHVKAFLWSYTPGSTIYHACEFGSACGTIEIIPATASTGYSVRCVHDDE